LHQLQRTMIKKSWALFFLIFANIVLFGHSIIPHHHVNNLPAIVPVHGHQFEICKPGHCNFYSENHKHHQGSELYHCLLNQLFLNRSNSQRIDVNDLNIANSNSDIFANYPDQLCLKYSGIKPKHLIPIHFIRSNYTDYVNRCSGLRAPPEV
jgi:hypothetical protein